MPNVLHFCVKEKQLGPHQRNEYDLARRESFKLEIELSPRTKLKHTHTVDGNLQLFNFNSKLRHVPVENNANIITQKYWRTHTQEIKGNFLLISRTLETKKSK